MQLVQLIAALAQVLATSPELATAEVQTDSGYTVDAANVEYVDPVDHAELDDDPADTTQVPVITLTTL